MGELKPKAPSRRPKKAAASPIPEGPMGGMTNGPVCGHGNCGRECAVRYVGPTSHMRDHHIVHAARGVAHVWTAAIVSGLAVVLTGAIAWTAVEAQSPDASSNASTLTEIRNLGKRIDRLELLLKTMNDRCEAQAKDCRTGAAVPPSDPVAVCIAACKTPSANGTSADACAKKCQEKAIFPTPTDTSVTGQ